MNNLDEKKKHELMDLLGELVIENVRDRALKFSMNIAKFNIANPVIIKKFQGLSDLTSEQQEAVCDLLSQTISDTIFRFLRMFDENCDSVRLLINDGDREYDIFELSEYLGSEIARLDEDGWIQNFSKVGRFV